MNKERAFSFLFLLFTGVAFSQVPSVSEYERAARAITQLIEDTEDLPTTVRLGKTLFNYTTFITNCTQNNRIINCSIP